MKNVILFLIVACLSVAATAEPRVSNLKSVYVSPSTIYITDRNDDKWIVSQSCDLNINDTKKVSLYYADSILREGKTIVVGTNKKKERCIINDIKKV